MIGVPYNELSTPPFEMVKVPPAMSSSVSCQLRAYRPSTHSSTRAAKRERQSDSDPPHSPHRRPRTHLLREARDLLLDLHEVHALRVPHDRRDEAFRRRDGDAQVDLVALHDLVALDRRVRRRDLPQRERRGLGERAHEGEFDPVLLQHLVLVLLPQLHDARHVDLVEGRQ